MPPTVRVTGTAALCKKTDADAKLVTAFESLYAPYVPRMSVFVMIEVTAAERVLSPA